MNNTQALLIAILVGGCAGHPTSPRVAEPIGESSESNHDELAALGYFDEKTAADAEARRRGKCPGAKDGSELVGTAAAEWTLTDWVNAEPLSLQRLRGSVVVVRFWTAGCPFCERTMPVLQKLSEEFRGQPVVFVGAFHAKPADSVSDFASPAAITKKWGVTFPVAFDRDWATLRSWWVDGTHHRHATSATFVIGKDGKIAHVHPGPVFYPSSDPEDAKPNRDFIEMREAIRTAVAK